NGSFYRKLKTQQVRSKKLELITEFSTVLHSNKDYKRFKPGCDQCRADGTYKKRKCFLSKPLYVGWKLTDYYGKEVEVYNHEELYDLYIIYANQQKDKFIKDTGGNCPDFEIDSFLDWLCNSYVNICPHSMCSTMSKYWIELIDVCDGETGCTLPMGAVDTPYIFYQALGIIRRVRNKSIKKD
ncbi:unnamed protein product, partial [marine sediment metagenome]